MSSREIAKLSPLEIESRSVLPPDFTHHLQRPSSPPTPEFGSPIRGSPIRQFGDFRQFGDCHRNSRTPAPPRCKQTTSNSVPATTVPYLNNRRNPINLNHLSAKPAKVSRPKIPVTARENKFPKVYPTSFHSVTLCKTCGSLNDQVRFAGVRRPRSLRPHGRSRKRSHQTRRRPPRRHLPHLQARPQQSLPTRTPPIKQTRPPHR